jgi:hypothetical protein
MALKSQINSWRLYEYNLYEFKKNQNFTCLIRLGMRPFLCNSAKFGCPSMDFDGKNTRPFVMHWSIIYLFYEQYLLSILQLVVLE